MSDANRCHFAQVKYYLIQCRFAIISAKYLMVGPSLSLDKELHQ